MSDIVISEFMEEGAVESLRAHRTVCYDPSLADDPARLTRCLREARALIVRNRTQVDAELLAAAPQLCVVGRLGVGLDNIDTAHCRLRSIEVLPATGANNVAVAEYVIAAMLLLVRGSFAMTAEVEAGRWPRGAAIGGEVSGRVLGLVGFGGIAREVATRAQALGLSLLAHDPALATDAVLWRRHNVQPVDSIEALLAGSDIVSLHVPLNAQTRHLIGSAELARMRTGACLINAARGGVVDDAALSLALREGRLAAAALDVFEVEPLPAGSLFEGLDNVLLTPHIAGVTHESNTRVSRMIADAVSQRLEEYPA